MRSVDVNHQHYVKKRGDTIMGKVLVHVPVCKRNWLRLVRSSMGLTLKTFGEQCGLSHETIGALERGNNKRPISISSAKRFCDFTHIPMGLFMKPTNADGKLEDAVYYTTLSPILTAYLGKEGVTDAVLEECFSDDAMHKILTLI